ncbi:MAG: hypothetical protein AAFP03_02675 [Cyanobacteria bacterium J06598_3]
MLGSKKRFKLSFIWILVNFVGIMTGTFVAFFLYALLTLNYGDATLDSMELLVQLALCGALQGFIVSGLQTMTLVLTKLRLVQWLLINIVGMSVGMVVPTALAIALNPMFDVNGSFDGYVMAGWVLSWILAGFLGGVVLGGPAQKKLRWGLLNGAAYLYWGLATALGMRLLGTALSNLPAQALGWWIGSLGFLTMMLAVGAWLHSYVFRGVVRSRK